MSAPRVTSTRIGNSDWSVIDEDGNVVSQHQRQDKAFESAANRGFEDGKIYRVVPAQYRVETYGGLPVQPDPEDPDPVDPDPEEPAEPDPEDPEEPDPEPEPEDPDPVDPDPEDPEEPEDPDPEDPEEPVDPEWKPYASTLWSWAKVTDEVVIEGASRAPRAVFLPDSSGRGHHFYAPEEDLGRSFAIEPTLNLERYDYQTDLTPLARDHMNNGGLLYGQRMEQKHTMICPGRFYLAAAIVNTRGRGNRFMWGSNFEHRVRLDQERGRITLAAGDDPVRVSDGIPHGPMLIEIWRDENFKIHVLANGIPYGIDMYVFGTLELSGWSIEGASGWDDYLLEFVSCEEIPTTQEIVEAREYFANRWKLPYEDVTAELPKKPEVGPPAGILADTVVVDGITFSKDTAEDLGDFHSPAGFVQKNLLAVNPDFPHYRVYFRPDSDGSRDEVVFEYGTMMETPQILDPYSVEIYGDDILLEKIDVNHPHGFYQRWRWIPNGYRPMYRTVDELEEQWLILPLSEEVYREPVGGQAGTQFYREPLDDASVTRGMPNTGERSDIGLVTGVQASFLITRSPFRWLNVLAQAEAAGSVPWNIRDEMGTPINMYREGEGIVDRLRLNIHGNNSGSSGHFSLGASGTGWRPDSAHQPALNYLPWALTGDPYYLEGLQFQNSYNTITTRSGRTTANLADVMHGQHRSMAWNLRSLFQLKLTTPENVPGWLNPRSYYERQSLENAAKYRSMVLESTHPAHVVLGYSRPSPTGSMNTWQHEMFAGATAWATLAGADEWRDAYENAYRMQAARVDGVSGWNRQVPIFSSLSENSEEIYQSWANLWEYWSTSRTLNLPEDPNELTGVSAYTNYLLGCLSLATHLNMPDAEIHREWLLQAWLTTRPSWTGHSKWAIVPKG